MTSFTREFYCPVCKNRIAVTVYDASSKALIVAECANKHKMKAMVDEEEA